MPKLLNVITESPEDAMEQAIEDAIKRAKDVWGLEYADESDGLYPSGSVIGRTQFRPSDAADGSQPYPETAGGQWRTVYDDGGVITALGTDANGWGTWLDFDVHEDAFIVIEGVFSTAAEPTIVELGMNLSGTSLPIMQLENGLYATEERTLRGYFEIPVVVSPKAEIIFKLRSYLTGVAAAPEANGTAISEGFGIIGDTVAKRSYLIKETH